MAQLNALPVDSFCVFMGTQKQGDFNEFKEALKEAERLRRLHPDRFVSVYDCFDDRHHQVKGASSAPAAMRRRASSNSDRTDS
jgi:hypothetical protein